MNDLQDIYSYITSEENAYDLPITVYDGYEWSMKQHIKTTILYKNSQLLSGKDDTKPVKNIILPILRLQYRAEGFDVKDIQLFVDDKDEYYKSMLVREFHNKWARENDIDTFLDDLVETYVDFGGVLVKDIDDVKPEVVPWQSIAFCDQTDFLSGPFGIKHQFSPDQLKDMEDAGWGKASNGATATIDELIQLAHTEKAAANTYGQKNATPGKYIEVYEVHGTLPSNWLKDNTEAPDEETTYTSQLQIVTFLKKADGTKQGITLFKGKEAKLPFKLLKRDGIYGRALGLGGAEELFESQVWTTYGQIAIKGMLDIASKTLYQTTDPNIAKRNKSGDLDNGEILLLDDGKEIAPLPTSTMNIELFERSLEEWQTHAQQLGSATGALLGEMPSTHTAFNTMSLVTSQGQAIHDYRRGKLATFVGEIYRDWVMPYISREVAKGQQFLSELDMDELQSIADNVVAARAHDLVKEKILTGQLIDPAEVDQYKQQVRDEFMKTGTKRFIEIFKGEMANIPLDVEVSIANKQKDLGKQADAVIKMAQFAFSTFNPQTGTFAVFEDPRMATFFNQALEMNGFDQLDTTSKPNTPPQAMALPQGAPPPQGQAVPSPMGQLPQPITQ